MFKTVHHHLSIQRLVNEHLEHVDFLKIYYLEDIPRIGDRVYVGNRPAVILPEVVYVVWEPAKHKVHLRLEMSRPLTSYEVDSVVADGWANEVADLKLKRPAAPTPRRRGV